MQRLQPAISEMRLITQMVKNLPASLGPCIVSPGIEPELESSPGEKNGYQLRILDWRIPWTEEPGRPPSMWPQRVGHN